MERDKEKWEEHSDGGGDLRSTVKWVIADLLLVVCSGIFVGGCHGIRHSADTAQTEYVPTSAVDTMALTAVR